MMKLNLLLTALTIAQSSAFMASIPRSLVSSTLSTSLWMSSEPKSEPVAQTAAERASEVSDEPEMNPDNPILPALKGDYDWDAEFAADPDWITENVPGKIVLNEVELAAQATALSKMEEKYRKVRLGNEYEEARIIGFVPMAEMYNGRFAMFFLVVGLLTEYWTGISIPGQIEEMARVGWAFSAAETLESHLAIATGEPVMKLSPQQIVSCAPNPDQCGGSGGCDGSTQPLAFNYTETAGITTDASYPYTSRTGTCDTSKITPVAYNSGYVELPVNDGAALMDAVANQGPVSISIAAGGFRFQFYGGGVLKSCNDYVMDHAVQLVGYGTESGQDYWLVRNSWGASWGESGYIRLARYGEGNEPCGEDKNPADGDACAGDTAPRTYCGECGVLSSSSYPTGMTAAIKEAIVV